MKDNRIVKKVILVMIVISVFMLALSFRAVYAALDLNSGGFESIGSGSTPDNTNQEPVTTTETPKNNVVENNTTNNTANNATNKSSSAANESKLPATGSNTEIIFAIGVAALAGTAIVIYKKASVKID